MNTTSEMIRPCIPMKLPTPAELDEMGPALRGFYRRLAGVTFGFERVSADDALFLLAGGHCAPLLDAKVIDELTSRIRSKRALGSRHDLVIDDWGRLVKGHAACIALLRSRTEGAFVFVARGWPSSAAA